MKEIEPMPRQPVSYRLDERVISVIETLARRSGVEPQRYLENYFFLRGKELELIAPEAQPLGETRGGKRAGAGKPKKPRDRTSDQPGGEAG
ncbi:MAG: hypothetical protein MUC48_05100 [Leptolyngbya sp. Prado105]|jgi:hypothetical protein|nr:hypothetical protein [Leptolyngbya sp. Prado105]